MPVDNKIYALIVIVLVISSCKKHDNTKANPPSKFSFPSINGTLYHWSGYLEEIYFKYPVNNESIYISDDSFYIYAINDSMIRVPQIGYIMSPPPGLSPIYYPCDTLYSILPNSASNVFRKELDTIYHSYVMVIYNYSLNYITYDNNAVDSINNTYVQFQTE